jgi:predicted secreted protein
MPTENVGQTVLISIGGTAVGTQRGGKVSVKVGGIDISSKADTWKRIAAGRKEWNFSLDGVVSTGVGGSMGLLTTALAGATVAFLLTDSVSGDTLTGTALLTAWDANFPDNAESTYTVAGDGHGELVYTPA